MTRDQDAARAHAQKELAFALELIESDDPNRYQDISDVLVRAAGRYAFLAEEARK